MSAKWLHAVGLVLLTAGVSGSAEKAAETPSAKSKFEFVEKASLPCVVYANIDDKDKRLWSPSGWMGSVDSIELDEGCKDNPHSGATCIKVTFTDPKKWGGIVWQNPPENWGDNPGGVDLTGAKELVVWARGEKGGEKVSLKVGGLGRDKPYFDTAAVGRENVHLSKDWKRYTLQLGGKNLGRIVSGFVFSVEGKGSETIVYLDDIQYE
jgi:hypothetical protein